MTYAVKEMFYTLQGEGVRAGRPALFVRFAGCNLWTGREQDRAVATCQFCDTEFVGTDGDGGGKFETPAALARAAMSKWPGGAKAGAGAYVVCTGGEPLLQLDAPLIQALHEQGFEIAVETNGTIAAPPGIDWICVSPKAGSETVQRSGDELKLIYPQAGAAPESFETWAFAHFLLQPMDGRTSEGALDADARERNTRAALEYCLAHPRWRLSLQTHKLLGLR
jgi:7-carboxy-7-deazaguanine synthase (Cx14CxxC type)